MPELPEVETIRRSLEELVLNKTIQGAEINYPNLLKNASPEQFSHALTGKTIEAFNRRGKYLLMQLSDNYTMVIHLRMTGQLRYEDPEETPRKHTHFILKLSDGKELRYVDTRKFGMIFIGLDDEVYQDAGIDRLGPEPLSAEFSVDYLRQILRGSKRVIKGLLLDQHKLAGLGNIYVDESLFRAGIHPESTSCCIPDERVEVLYQSIKDVLRDGIENRGTTLNDYVDGFGKKGSFQFMLNVYGRKDEVCHECGNPIAKCRVVQRGTHFCPICQVKYE